jgi:hypothetical protein
MQNPNAWKQGYTDEEIAEAEKLYNIECKAKYERGYVGDFGSGLRFAMETYNPICWQHFFKRPPPGVNHAEP